MLSRFKAAPRVQLARSVGTGPLRTHDDWRALQVKRAEVGTLIDIFSRYGSNRTQENTFRLRNATKRPQASATVSALLAAGAHFGHSKSRLNPNFSPYAYGVRAGATIIDLDHTVPLLRRAAQLVRAVAFVGGQILFIGTRPDLRQVVKTSATRLGKQGYYISDRWIPGTLTNTSELYSPEIAAETLAVPDLVVFLNPLANLTAIRECALSHVPTIGIIDSDADPRIVMYPIPANDESTQTAELIAGILSIAGREGLALRLEEEAMAEEVQLKRDDDDFWNELEAMHKDAQRGNEKITDGKIVDGDDLQVKVGDYNTLDVVEEAAADAEELAEELEEELGYNFMEEESDEEGDDDTRQKGPTEDGQHFDH